MNADSVLTNWAEVAQQMLEAGELAVTQAAGLVKETAPDLWEIMIRQVYVEAGLGMAIGLVVLALALFVRHHAVKHEYKDVSNQAGAYACYYTAIILSVIGSLLAARGFLNPEYYAIQKFFTIAAGGM